VEEIVNDLRYMKEFDKIGFAIVVDPAAMVMTDAPRLKIIVTNLVSNAIKYADPTKTQKEVKIQFEKGNTSWKLYISDNGIGIDKKVSQPCVRNVLPGHRAVAGFRARTLYCQRNRGPAEWRDLCRFGKREVDPL